MAKIIKVGSQNPTFTSQKIANPFKTSRKSVTDPFRSNPFMYSNFEGNSLPFADVFEGFENKKSLAFKGKMISSAVVGSMNKMKSSVVEPIVNFVKRTYTGVKEGAAAAWNLTFRTPISEVPGLRRIPGIKKLDETMSMEVTMPSIAGIAERASDIGKAIAFKGKMDYLKKDIKDVGRDMKDGITEGINTLGEGLTTCWESLKAKFPAKKNYNNMSVEELRTELAAELALGGV